MYKAVKQSLKKNMKRRWDMLKAGIIDVYLFVTYSTRIIVCVF